ncbi:hypothetical protein H0H81_006519 [Sphagnurus paluster]|uniref:Uncharacterized protein n=1 Tax=Sphagnurus paluster TaxID=117069 RepID=A0A9P7GL16_9AGAR|nr:hypothetical protein H0H81_006519 [Sphagnurus paluster]
MARTVKTIACQFAVALASKGMHHSTGTTYRLSGARDTRFPVLKGAQGSTPNRRKWWKQPISTEGTLKAASPRVGTSIVFTNNHLSIFGGEHDRDSIPDGEPEPQTFSIARFDSHTCTWKWVVVDQPYPEHIPWLGSLGDAVPIYGGEKIVLFPGVDTCEVDGKFLKINMSAATTVIFNTATRTFELGNDPNGINITGEFPHDFDCFDAHVVSSRYFIEELTGIKRESQEAEGDPKGCSLLIATWDSSNLMALPEMWLMNLSRTPGTPSTSRCLYLRPSLETVKVPTENAMSMMR